MAGYAWSEGEVSRLAELWEIGAMHQAITETLGKTVGAVQEQGELHRPSAAPLGAGAAPDGKDASLHVLRAGISK